MSSNSNTTQISRAWRIYKNIIQLVLDRGYSPLYVESDISINDFKLKFAQTGSVDRSNMQIIAQKKNDPADQMLVIFPEDKSVGIKPIRDFCELLISKNASRGIVIYQKSMTPSAVKIMNEVSVKYTMEAFNESELLINITKHVLVPMHIVLSNEEKKLLLQKYHLKETQLPRIQITDPVARYYGLSRGQVVKIIRKSETAGRYITYRLCL